MIKPTIEEVKDYFFLKLQDLELAKEEGEKFFNYYSSCGWIVGRNKPMKAWKFAILNWIKNYNRYESNTKTDTSHRFQRW